MFDREIIESNRPALLRQVNLRVKRCQMKSLRLSHISFAGIKINVKEEAEGGRCVIYQREEEAGRQEQNKEEQPSRREMKDKRVEEEVEESVVTLDTQCPLCRPCS